MSKRELLVKATGHALLIIMYIFGVVVFLNNGEKFFGNFAKPIGGLIFLSVFVISAAIMAILFFGRPLQMYLDNKKSEAVKFLGYTIGILVSLVAIIFLILAVINQTVK